MRPKVLFLVFHGFDAHNGISKKIWGQVKGLQQCGADTRLCYYQTDADGRRGWVVDDHPLVDFGTGLLAKIRKRIDYMAVLDYAIQEKISLVYIRSDHNANPFTIGLVKALRKVGCQMVMEIPTYPYDREYDGHAQKRKLFIDRLFRRSLAQQLDAIVTFSEEDYIFGQKTIRISNGIDFDTLPLRQHRSQNDSTIHLLAVAEIHYWHGFDRIIEGLQQYNRQGHEQHFIFHLVGPLFGEREQSEILDRIQSYGLQQQVIYYGPLSGPSLDAVFDIADFAVGSLGRHRTGISQIKTLKNREYAARGIPFMYAENDADFDHQDFVLKIIPDDSPVDLNQVRHFVRTHTFSAKAIRDCVIPLSWKNQMQHVLTTLLKVKNDNS